MKTSLRLSVTLGGMLLMVTALSFAQTPPQTPGKHFAIVGFYQSQASCHPVEVKAVSSGFRPPDVTVTSLVVVESFSSRPVTALKLSWMFFGWDEGLRRRREPCEPLAESKAVLSGTGPLIQVGELLEKETCTITSGQPAVSGPPTTKTILIDQPIIVWDDVKSLTLDGTLDTLKDNYAGIIYVSELHFADGTVWYGKI